MTRIFPSRAYLLALGAALWLAGCAAGGADSIASANARAYTLRRAERGAPDSGHVTLASWYGPGFNGERTASGEVYHQDDLTAASRSLPLGTRARVTNLNTGRSVVVRINDRGPFVRGRGIDLSHGAAERIGLNHSGIARVAVTRVDRTDSAASSSSADQHWSGKAQASHCGPRCYRRRERYRPRYHYQYVSAAAYRRSPGTVNDPVGEWLLQMAR